MIGPTIRRIRPLNSLGCRTSVHRGATFSTCNEGESMTITLSESYWPAQASSGVRDITLPGLLREAAAAEPDRLALVDAVADPAARRHWTYTEFLADTEKVARALLGRF